MIAIPITPAQPADAEAIADLFARSRHRCLPFLPVLHSRAEDIAFFARLVAAGEVVVLRQGDAILGFMAVTPGWVDQLYLDPDQRGKGLGRRLIEHAKAGQSALQLWCYADNHAARAFYAAQGFAEIGGSAGDNEAGLLDILFRWQRA